MEFYQQIKLHSPEIMHGREMTHILSFLAKLNGAKFFSPFPLPLVKHKAAWYTTLVSVIAPFGFGFGFGYCLFWF